MKVFSISESGRLRRDVVFLPGILAHGAVQASPIVLELGMVGDVYTCDYDLKFDGGTAAETTADFVEESVGAGREVVLFGTSLGGQLALDACRLLPLGVRRYVHSIMVDTPAGLTTMRDVPEWAVTHGVADALFGLPLGPLGRLKVPVTESGLPKDENIVLPEEFNDLDTVSGLNRANAYLTEVHEAARLGLSGHRVGTWQRQLRYMAQLNLSQGFTNSAGLASLSYIACTGDNTTVRQPEAAQAWHQATWRCKVFEVATAHAAFLEARPVWVQRLPEIFREIGLLH